MSALKTITKKYSVGTFCLFLIIGVLSADNAQARREMLLEQNTAEVVRIDQDVTEIFVANPDIADIQLNTPTVAYVYAKTPGTTTIFATNAKGDVVLELELIVTHNLRHLKRILRSTAPGDNIKVNSSPEGIVLSGSVSSSQISRNVENVASRFVTGKQQIVNNLSISQPTQVYLKVKIAEVRRVVLDRLNINWGVTIAGQSSNMTFGLLKGRNPLTGGVGANTFSRIDTPPILDSIGLRYQPGRSADATVLLDALDQESLATILAEPNLICISGETASFLVGGEFPVPVPQDENITIEFKEFGIRLAFTPIVLSNGLINLRVRPEVSEIDRSNAVSFTVGGTATGQNIIVVPGLLTRRAETTVELASGQTLAIAGLFSNSITNSLSELPGLADLPVLGALFRSTEFKRNETELVITVTAYTVKPTQEADITLPTDGLKPARHIETIFFKRLNRLDPITTGGSAATPSTDVALAGSSGFYIE